MIPKIKIDAEIDIKDINSSLFLDIEKLAPFGPGNEEPCFLISNSTIQELSEDKNGKRFNLKIVDLSGAILSLTGFGSIERLTNQKEEPMDMVVRIYKGNFGGESFYKFHLEDFKMAKRIPLGTSSKRKRYKYLIHVENDIEKNFLLEKIKKKRK